MPLSGIVRFSDFSNLSFSGLKMLQVASCCINEQETYLLGWPNKIGGWRTRTTTRYNTSPHLILYRPNLSLRWLQRHECHTDGLAYPNKSIEDSLHYQKTLQEILLLAWISLGWPNVCVEILSTIFFCHPLDRQDHHHCWREYLTKFHQKSSTWVSEEWLHLL